MFYSTVTNPIKMVTLDFEMEVEDEGNSGKEMQNYMKAREQGI